MIRDELVALVIGAFWNIKYLSCMASTAIKMARGTRVSKRDLVFPGVYVRMPMV